MPAQPPLQPSDALPDRNFNDLTQRFQRTIYDTPRGQLRLMALRQDFSDLDIPLTNARILDMGGGQGQFSLELAHQGADIHLGDISEAMLAVAIAQFQKAQRPLNARPCRLQDMHTVFPGTFSIVLNHAVLEWLERPFEALPLLCDKVAENGWLSLLFYNKHGHQWRQLMNGRTHAPASANPHLRNNGNAPQHPLDPIEVEQHLNALGFSVTRWRGIRCIHDHMHQKIRQRIGQEAVNEADLSFGLQEPYRQLGRYVHFLAQRRPL